VFPSRGKDDAPGLPEIQAAAGGAAKRRESEEGASVVGVVIVFQDIET
jgi:hypothetical protein